MRLANVQPGDTIRANVRGLLFSARVEALDDTDIPGKPIRVRPLSKGVGYFYLAASQVRERLDPSPRTHRRHNGKDVHRGGSNHR